MPTLPRDQTRPPFPAAARLQDLLTRLPRHDRATKKMSRPASRQGHHRFMAGRDPVKVGFWALTVILNSCNFLLPLTGAAKSAGGIGPTASGDTESFEGSSQGLLPSRSFRHPMDIV
jgi:hypothetical protein